jgi:chromosome segregation protein
VFLKSLTLKGFKSFADKTELVFEPGVTVVVGPNGSGKSNLVDAVAWVLGAQGPRTLRGGKMDDVIFAGTASRSPLGRAEVELTIDNTAGLLPIEFSEVTITRTLFRTGESEYQINGVPCRLLDVQELLSDAGVGRQQHVIVGQGQLDTVLNASPAERRAIIEEAAGILKFRRRKERAERRLTATEGNLLRLGDLLREVRRQLGPLERQADAARRHGAVVEELRAIKLHLLGHQIAGQQARIERLRDERAELAARERDVQERLRELDKAVLAAEQALAELGADELADELVRAESLRERVRGLTSLLAEKRRSVTRELAAAADEGVVETLVADAVALRSELEALDAGGDHTLPGTEAALPVDVAEDLLRAAEERWRNAEAAAARARARADALAQQLHLAREAGGAGSLDGLEGIVGALVDHVEIEPGAEAAVAAALGDAMLAVVVHRGDGVRGAIERLEADGARALLLVADTSGDAGVQPALVPPGARRVTELVRTDVPGLAAALGQLLAHTVLVDSWRSALDLVVAQPELVAVTPDGSRLGGAGPWRIGPGGPVAGVTQAAVDEAVAQASAADVERAEAERAVERARATLNAARASELRRATVAERRSVLAARLREVEARLAARDPEAQAAAERQRRNLLARDEAYLALEERLGSLRTRAEALHEQLREERRRHAEAARASAEQLDGLRAERGRLEQRLAEIRERMSRVELEDAEAKLRLENVIQTLRSEYDVEPHVALDAPAPCVPDGTTLAGRARELERDLRLMGPINPLALEEYDALAERHRFLQEQLDDVKATRRELSRVIRAVDREIVSVFEQAYRDVADHFAGLFTTLFPGGSGRLALVDADDLLNTGVEIEARPSGKNVRRLSLLSGGERSLTALAFLFAVFRARPSPFYLLDEVEAALDDVNLHRFLDLVHEFRDEAQLVIVSHQKRTMEAADVLYGVSMPPGGSSRVVSQRARDVFASV